MFSRREPGVRTVLTPDPGQWAERPPRGDGSGRDRSPSLREPLIGAAPCSAGVPFSARPPKTGFGPVRRDPARGRGRVGEAVWGAAAAPRGSLREAPGVGD